MATVGLYGSTASSTVASPTGSESVGLYGNNTVFGGSYFEWFIFQVADTQPVTPTGGTWDFTTNTGTPPTGWVSTPPANPTNTVWVSIGLVNSKSSVAITWSAPGKFSFASGLPILSGTAAPLPGDGQSDQLYIQTSTTPETIWFKQAGTWTRLTGSTLYADLTSNQTIAGIKTFSSPIVGSVTGTSANVTGVVAVVNGGTGVTTSTGSGSNVLSTAPTLNNPTISNYEAFTPSTAPTYAEGLVWYDSASYALAYYNNTTNNTVHLGQELQQQVRNSTGSTITKGQVVYISGSTGQIGNVILAQANTYVASQVIGVANQDIPNNTNGWIVTQGTVTNINTAAFTAGNPIYLSATTAGALTQTEPNTPNYAVHMGVCLYSNTNNGKIYICPINKSIDTGYIIGQVAIAQGGTNGTATPTAGAVAYGTGTAYGFTAAGTSGQVLTSSGTGAPTWTTPTTGTVTSVTGTSPVVSSGGATPAISLASGYGDTQNPYASKTANYILAAPNGAAGVPTFRAIVAADIPTLNQNTTGTASNVTGTVAIANGGTGQTTANAAFNALAPSQATNAGKYLTTDGTNTSWATNPLGTVTSVAATVPSFLSITGSPITTSGTLAIGLSGTALPTANGGTGLTSFTANGVVYASSTSALTTGSALTFDGTTFKVTGADAAINSIFAGATNGIRIIPKAASAEVAATDKTGTGSYQQLDLNGSLLTFLTSGSEQMRLTSTGLGIGTSSPTFGLGKGLQIVNSTRANLGLSFTGSDGYEIFYNGSGNLYIDNIGGTGGNVVFRNTATRSQTMLLDSSGNLGLGVTPSAWGLGKAFEVGNAGNALWSVASGDIRVMANAYYNGSSYIYSTTNNASYYRQSSGQHQWLNAPSGTAGNAITFSQVMTLDANGRLGIGTTSPNYTLDLVSSAAAVINLNSTNTAGPEIRFASSGTRVGDVGTGKVLTGGSATDFGINTAGANSLIFATNDTERARIDSSGNLLVGTTTVTSVASGGFYLSPSSVTGYTFFDIGHATGTASGAAYSYFRYAGSAIGSITQSGTTAVLFNVTSDQRLKENIVDAPEFGSVIDSIKVRSYDWKAEGSHQRAGFIAQELVTVAPEAVHQPVDPEEMMAVDYSKLVPMLVKEIQSLRQRLAALEAK